MEEQVITWKKVLQYVPLSNGNFETIVGTLKKSIGRMMNNGEGFWEGQVKEVLSDIVVVL